MRSLLVVFIIALLSLAAARSGWLQPPTAQGAPLLTTARTLARDADPIIVTGQQMPLFVGVPLNKLFVYAYSGGTWHVVLSHPAILRKVLLPFIVGNH